MNAINLEEFGKRITELRENSGNSQEEICAKLGVTQQTLSRYEKGQRQASLDFVVKASKYFNVSSDYLLGLSDVKSSDDDIKTLCRVTELSEKAISELNYFKDIPKIKNENTNFYNELHTMMLYSFLAIFDTDDFKSNFYKSDTEYVQKHSLEEIMKHAKDALHLFIKYCHNAEENYKYIKYDMEEMAKTFNKINIILDGLYKDMKKEKHKIRIGEVKKNPEIQEEIIDKIIKNIEELKEELKKECDINAQHNPEEE